MILGRGVAGWEQRLFQAIYNIIKDQQKLILIIMKAFKSLK